MHTPEISSQRPPALWLSVALAFCLAGMALAIGLALQMPWLDLRLQAGADDGVIAVQSRIAAMPAGARLLSIAAPGQPAMALAAKDLLEDPGVLGTYADYESFLARQQALASVLRGPAVELRWQAGAGASVETATRTPHKRRLGDLPLLFWFQLAVSALGCLIACWVWVLRPRDWGGRMFGLTGLAFPLFAMSAAVYSTRELALPGDWFRVLAAMNSWGAVQFGVALGCIFLIYPRPLVRPVLLLGYFLLFNLWWLADLLQLLPSRQWGAGFVTIVEMLLAIVFAIAQWRRSRGDALGRASLRWLSLSMLVGSGLFIMLIVATAALGWLPPMSQGYAFGFFLFIYIGIALGLRRYRLFELDEWAYRMLLWIGGALAVVGVDALLILVLDWSDSTALGASLWICGALYFPARQWLWQRLAQRPAMQAHELMPDVVHIAFQPSRPTQEMLWDDLLRRIHEPMQLEPSGFAGRRAALDDAGLMLQVPACGGIAARCLRYPARGQRLFSSKDATFMNALCQLMDQAQAGRDAYERGASEERRRIARDMHDDVGARLLMLIHRAGSPELIELARSAMHDLRTALHVMDAHDVLLADAIADWRAEAAARCEAARVEFDWEAVLPEAASATGDAGAALLVSRQKATLERVLREGLTNALRHGQPRRVQIEIRLDANLLHLAVRNDGSIGSPRQWSEGRGLRGMRGRLQEWGGSLSVDVTPQGWAELAVQMPLKAFSQAQEPV